VLDELIRRCATDAPERPLLVSERNTLRYGACHSRALSVSVWMRSQGVDRVGIAAEDPGSIVIALVAAAMAGKEPCVYPRGLDQPGIGELAARLGHNVVLTDDLPEGAYLPAPEARDGAAAPVLILTTGTTGEPKAARHDWARLAESVRHPDEASAARWLLAYNLNQFAGIQVLIHVLVSGSTLIAPRSARSQDVVEALRVHEVTHLSATPTFWRLLIGAIGREQAEALALRQITLGGEVVSQSVLDRLAELFPGARITHVYAGTEIGSVISVNDGRAGLPISVLDRGEESPVSFRIVDHELHVRSNSGMLGYHAEETEDRGGWRATGDRVEIRGDRIHFAGRISEIINVGGAKVSPLPIEEIACAVNGVEIAAAYGHPSPVTGEIVALDVVAVPGADQATVELELRKAFRGLPRPGRPRRIRFVESLEMTGHKVIRRVGK